MIFVYPRYRLRRCGGSTHLGMLSSIIDLCHLCLTGVNIIRGAYSVPLSVVDQISSLVEVGMNIMSCCSGLVKVIVHLASNLP